MDKRWVFCSSAVIQYNCWSWKGDEVSLQPTWRPAGHTSASLPVHLGRNSLLFNCNGNTNQCSGARLDKSSSGKVPVALCISSQSYGTLHRLVSVACVLQASVNTMQGHGKGEKVTVKREKSWRQVYKYTSLRCSRKVLEPWSCLLQHPWRLKGQTASAGGRSLGALHHSRTLLSLLQLVVLKEALVSRNAMSSIWESQ